jgi:hypothetical protein
MKTIYPVAIVLAGLIAACGEKTPPAPNAPKPKVEAVTPAAATPAAATPMPPAAPSAAPASAGQDAKTK